MPHAFDMSALPHLIRELGRLAEYTREHDRRLTALIGAIESTSLNQIAVVTPEAVADGAPRVDARALPIVPTTDLVTEIRELYAAAPEHRFITERLLEHFGGSVDGNGTGHSDRVLVVDDSDDNRDLAATILDAYGFHVTTATNGLEGIIAAHCTLPSAILMDITMPVLNGIEAARLLKASPITRDIRVLAYTANAGFYDGPLAQLFAGVLTKPAHPEAIAQLVLGAVHLPNGDRS